MAKTSVGDLAIVLSADSSPLAADLRTASKYVADFRKEANAFAAQGAIAEARASAKTFAEFKRGALEAAAFRQSQTSASNAFLGSLGRAGRGANDLRAAYSEAGTAGVASFVKTAGAMFAAGAVMEGLKVGAESVAWAFGQIKDSVKLAAEVEQTNLAFEVMLGDAKDAAAMVSNLRKYSAETPFSSKEVIASARALVAYGIAADQVVPTLKMLGDVSAAFGKDLPLTDLTGVYGKIFNEQRAFTVDLKELSRRGVPIYDELEKTIGRTKAELHELTEAGRLGRDEITGAFISMTSAGGRFFNMTRRQSETLAGLWETAGDAVDMVKVKFGQMIIEETGLKGIVKDVTTFADKLEHDIDTRGIRDVIHFTGDAAKAAAQLTYEFTRAGVSAASIGLQGLTSSFPEAQRAAESVNQMLKEAQNFKIDKRQLTETVLDVTGGLVVGLATGIDWLKKTGTAIEVNLVNPLSDAVKRLAQLTAMSKAPLTTWNATILKEFGLFDTGKPEKPPAAYAAPALPKDDAEVLRLFKEAKKYRDESAILLREHLDEGLGTNAARTEELKRRAQERDEDFENIIKAFSGKREDIIGALDKGVVPGRGPWPPVDGKPVDRSTVDIARDHFQSFRKGVIDGLDNAAIEEAKRVRDTLKAVGDELGGAGLAAILSPFGGLAGPALWANDRRNQGDALSGLGGGMAGLGLDMLPFIRNTSGVRMMGDLPGSAADLMKALREKYDPLNENGELMRTKRDLDALLAAEKISPKMHELGWRDAVQGTANRLGIGPTQLPEAMSRDSEQATRTINAWMSNDGKQRTTEGLLEAIRSILSEMLGLDRKSHGPPTVIHLPRAP